MSTSLTRRRIAPVTATSLINHVAGGMRQSRPHVGKVTEKVSPGRGSHGKAHGMTDDESCETCDDSECSARAVGSIRAPAVTLAAWPPEHSSPMAGCEARTCDGQTVALMRSSHPYSVAVMRP
jgi:hypothetical protein